MINLIRGKGINEVVYNSIEQLILEGDRTPSRNGDVSSFNNVFLNIDNPRNRHLNLKGRKNNIFATIAETFWVFSGEDKIDPLLSFFLPRAKDFSDDGEVWYGAYGPRLYNYGQMDDIIQQFRNEGMFTRRASFYIGAPELDTKESFQKHLDGVDTIRDRPCNMNGNFFITQDNKLHLNMFSRSGDILWGIGSINIFEWTFFQEFMLQELKREISSDIELGEYHHFITNMHLYDFSGKQGYDVYSNRLEQELSHQNHAPLYFPNGVDNFKGFMKKICGMWGEVISSDAIIPYKELKNKFTSIFNEYGVQIEGNLLYTYTELVSAYIITKFVYGEEIEIDISDKDIEFQESIKNSSFRKFKLKGE